jgi:hypothetical protein
MKRTEAESKDLSRRFTENNKRLAAIINPLSTAKYEADFDWRGITRALDGWAKDYGGMELNPDFQRGHVWTAEQQQHYIENVLRGVVSSSGFVLQFNCPNWDSDKVVADLPKGFQCIDGLQRLTAVQEFLEGNVKPFGLSPSDLDISSFSMRGSTFRFRVAVHTFSRREDLLSHYLALNTGGTPHSKEEIERVKALLNSVKEG